jgi:hypothetical protein
MYFRPTHYSKVTIQQNLFQTHNLQQTSHPTQFILDPHTTAKLPTNQICFRPTAYSKITTQQTILDPHTPAKLPSNQICSRPTAYSKRPTQHNLF